MVQKNKIYTKAQVTKQSKKARRKEKQARRRERKNAQHKRVRKAKQMMPSVYLNQACPGN